MVETLSTMMPLRTSLPGFSLTDAVTGRTVTERDIAGERATLVMFLCNHCPYVKHVLGEIGRLTSDYSGRGVGVVAINSNDIAKYPQDGPDHMKELAKAEGWKFPFLLDASQSVAKAYQAACTPDFFLFDEDRKLFYRGQLDDSRPGSGKPVTGRDLRAALDAALLGGVPPAEQRPSAGCNIKWKPGNAPAYFG